MQSTYYFKVVIIVSLLILLSSSSFSYVHYLKSTLTTLQLNDIQQARKKGYFSDLLIAFAQLPQNNKQWLTYAYMLAPYQGDIAYQLAQHFNPQILLDSSTALTLKKRQQQYEYWLTYSVKLKYIPAITPLVNVLIEQNKYEQAQQILQPYHLHSHLLKKAFILAVNEGDKVRIKQLKVEIATNKSLTSFVNKTNQYLIGNNNLHDITFQKRCVHSRTVQPYATNFTDLAKTEQLITQLEQYPLVQYFCFLPVRYIPLPDLFCQYKNEEAISCDESRWPEKLTAQTAIYSIVLLPKGGANVHGNIMYLDSNDTALVVLHELSHFLDFVDEYPLVNNHVFCQPDTTHNALNVALLPKYWLGEQAVIRKKVMAKLPWKNYIDERTSVLTLLDVDTLSQYQLNDIPKALLALTESDTNKQLWQLGTTIESHVNSVKNKEKLKVGVYPALTCTNSYTNINRATKVPLLSVKALYEQTALEYFELPFPQLYLELIEQNL